MGLTYEEQLRDLYDKLGSLSDHLLLTIIEELDLPESSTHGAMVRSIVSSAYYGKCLSTKQKRVLVNFIAKG